MPRFLLNRTLSLLFTGGTWEKKNPPHTHFVPSKLDEENGPLTVPALPYHSQYLLSPSSVLESALGLDELFPLHMCEQTEGNP